MNRIAINNSLFIKYLLSGEIIANASSHRLIELAEFALSLGEFDALSQVGALLCQQNPANSDFYAWGLLYVALALNRSAGCRVQAEGLLLSIAEGGTSSIRIRALLALGSNRLVEGDSSEAITYYQSASLLDSQSPLTIFYTVMESVVAQSMEGRHRDALDSLNAISHLASYVGSIYRPYWFDYKNAVAVELNETGHTEEAREVLAPALRSPFSIVRPAYAETGKEIAQRESTGKLISMVKQTSDKKPTVEQKRGVCLVAVATGPESFILDLYEKAKNYAGRGR